MLKPIALCAIPAAMILMVLAGCLPVDVVDDPESPPTETETPEKPVEPVPDVVEQPQAMEPEEPAPPPTIPEVNLTESLSATCLVGVGDPLPSGELTDLEGKVHSIHDLLGEELTVLLFWNSGSMHSVVQLEDLARDTAGPLAERGGRVIAVNVGDTAAEAAEIAKQAKAEFPILLDPERAYFENVATERLPRVYALDAEGTILWFDLEYSRTTRRDLEQTIDVALAEEPAT